MTRRTPPDANTLISTEAQRSGDIPASLRAPNLSAWTRLKRTGPLFTALLSTVCLISLSGCRSVPPPTPLNQLNVQQAQGYNVFQSRCAVCHYERTDQPKNGPALVGLFKKPYLPSGTPANDDRVTLTILHGRGMMPGQPNLDPDSLAALLAYLHSL